MDLEGPPTQMEYVNSYKVRTGAMSGGRGEGDSKLCRKKKSQVSRDGNSVGRASPRLLLQPESPSRRSKCCGSGSGVRLSGIRNRFFLDPGSQTHIFELSDKFLGKKLKSSKFYNCLKKRYDNKFVFTSLFCCCFWILDPRSIGKNQDPR